MGAGESGYLVSRGAYEIPVKVNAWIDAGVALLVAALNDFEAVMTLASCEGDTSRDAYRDVPGDGEPRAVLGWPATSRQRLAALASYGSKGQARIAC